MMMPKFLTRKTVTRRNGQYLSSVDTTRDRIATKGARMVASNPTLPISPITCSGTSFQCPISGSGKTPIINVPTYPTKADFIATPMKEGGMSGRSFQPDFILNWQNNSIATAYTKNSLKNTYGFENFQ